MERRQNQWDDVPEENEDEGKENHGNTGLPFGLCAKYGIKLPDGATPRDAWNALEKEKGILPPWKEKTEGNGEKKENKHSGQTEKKKTAYDVIENEETKAKIHGDFITAKPYSLIESWINVSKRGYGYYFPIDVSGEKYFVSMDAKTANDRRWIEPSILGYKNMKITANGYIYVDKKGYANFVIKDLNNFTRIFD